VLLSGGLSQRSKNVIRPVIDCAAPPGFPPPIQVITPFPWIPRSVRLGGPDRADASCLCLWGDVGEGDGGEIGCRAAEHDAAAASGSDLLSTL